MKKNLFALVFFTIGFLSFAQMFNGKYYRNEKEVKEALSKEFILIKKDSYGVEQNIYKLFFGSDVSCYVNFSEKAVTFKLFFDVDPVEQAKKLVSHFSLYYGTHYAKRTDMGLLVLFSNGYDDFVLLIQEEGEIYLIITYKD